MARKQNTNESPVEIAERTLRELQAKYGGVAAERAEDDRVMGEVSLKAHSADDPAASKQLNVVIERMLRRDLELKSIASAIAQATHNLEEAKACERAEIERLAAIELRGLCKVLREAGRKADEALALLSESAGTLAESVASIIGSTDDDRKAAALAESFEQAEAYLKSFAACARGDDADQHGEDGTVEGRDADGDKVSDLLSNERCSAYRLALHERLNKSEDSNAMTKTTEQLEAERIAKLRAVVKAHGIVSLAKDNDAHAIDEHEFVKLATEDAQRRYPDMRPDAAFTKLFSANTEEAAILRRAHQVVKSMPAYFDLQPLVVDGKDALNVNDPSEAIRQLTELGRQRWPSLSEAQAFERAFSDPANAKLAAKAHQRPGPTTFYAYPR
jgi:hypothetical protein